MSGGGRFAEHLGAGQDAVDHGDDGLRWFGLGDEACGAAGASAHPDGGVVAAGDQHHRQFGAVRRDGMQKGEAVYVRQAHVADRQVRGLTVQHVHRFAC